MESDVYRLLAANDDGSGLTTDRAIAILQASKATPGPDKIPVVDDTIRAPKAVTRFSGLRAKIGNQASQPGRSSGQLRPTGRERSSYAALSPAEETNLHARRVKSLAPESREKTVFNPQITPLDNLGKTSQYVHCPYCKQTTMTRVEHSDSKTSKTVNALLWAGLGDPFALTAHD